MRRLTRRQRWAAIALALVALVFLTLDLGGSSLADAHGGVRGAFGALYRGTDSVLGPVKRFVQGVPGAASNQDRIDQLEAREPRAAAATRRRRGRQGDRRAAAAHCSSPRRPAATACCPRA